MFSAGILTNVLTNFNFRCSKIASVPSGIIYAMMLLAVETQVSGWCVSIHVLLV